MQESGIFMSADVKVSLAPAESFCNEIGDAVYGKVLGKLRMLIDPL